MNNEARQIGEVVSEYVTELVGEQDGVVWSEIFNSELDMADQIGLRVSGVRLENLLRDVNEVNAGGLQA
jgi:hypothetical protein